MDNIINFDDLRRNDEIIKQCEEILKDSLISPDGNAYYQKGKFRGRTAHIIYVDRHYSKEAIELYKKRLQSAVLINKQSWLFLIEGLDEALTPEVQFFKRLGEELNIPTDTPVVNTYSKETIEITGISELDAIMTIAFHELPTYRSIELVAEHLRHIGIGDEYTSLVMSTVGNIVAKHSEIFEKY